MARAAATSDRAGETQRRLVDAAITLFTEHGYHATSLNDVIAAAGSTKGGFYFHFSSKAELALAAIESTRTSFQREVLAATEQHELAADQLVAMVRAIAKLACATVYGGGFARLCNELRDEPGVPPEALDVYTAWIAIVEEMLVRARAEGALDDGIDLTSAARYAVGAYAGVEGLDGSKGSTAFYDQIDDHMRFTFRAIGLHSALLG
jgi:AcrR family transcriptional regulator